MSIKVSWGHGDERVTTHPRVARLTGLPPCAISPPLIFFLVLLQRKKQAPTARFCANYILLPRKRPVPASSPGYGVMGFLRWEKQRCLSPCQGAASRTRASPGTGKVRGQAAPRREAAAGDKPPRLPLGIVL